MNTAAPPARLWVLMASEADLAVVFRRGPNRWTRLYLWDTRTDTFTPGSWFDGRLYEWQSDLSPDGQHLLYVARNESPRRKYEAQRKFGVDVDLDVWTALSQPPWVRAVGLWNAGGLSGGGVFMGNRAVSLNYGSRAWISRQQFIAPDGFEVQAHPEPDSLSPARLHPALAALERTGWAITHHPERWSGMGEGHPLILQKHHLELRVISSLHDRQYVLYRWLGRERMPDLEGVTWADLDRSGQLLFARRGKLFRVRNGAATELTDLNGDQPSRRTAPPLP